MKLQSKEEINSSIMEIACEKAAERLVKKYGKPFTEFIEPLDPDDPYGSTAYKAEYQDEFNRFYDEEYTRLAQAMQFDISEGTSGNP